MKLFEDPVEKAKRSIDEEVVEFMSKGADDISVLLIDMANIRIELKKGYLGSFFLDAIEYDAFALKLLFERGGIIEGREISAMADSINHIILSTNDEGICEALFCTELTILCMCPNFLEYGTRLWGYLASFKDRAIELLKAGISDQESKNCRARIEEELAWDPIRIYSQEMPLATIDPFEHILEHVRGMLDSQLFSRKQILRTLELSDYSDADSLLIVERAKILSIAKSVKLDHDIADYIERLFSNKGYSHEAIEKTSQNVIHDFLAGREDMTAFERRMLSELTRFLADSIGTGSRKEDFIDKLVENNLTAREEAECFLEKIVVGLEYYENVDWSILEKIHLKYDTGEDVRLENLDRDDYDEFMERHIKNHSVYLRSHVDDKDLYSSGYLLKTKPRYSYEQILINDISDNYGIPVAILGPREEACNLRFPRLSTEYRDWKTAAAFLMLTSTVVLIKFNTTEGLTWEISTALKYVKPESLIIGFPDYLMLDGKKKEWEGIWDSFLDLSSRYIGNVDDRTIRKNCCQFVWFNHEWVPSIANCPYSYFFSQSDRILWSLKKLIDDRGDIPLSRNYSSLSRLRPGSRSRDAPIGSAPSRT
jgi:hypothetical protein